VLQRYIYLYRSVRPNGEVGPVVADAVAESSVYNSDSCGRDDLGICSVKAAVSEKQNSVSAETEGGVADTSSRFDLTAPTEIDVAGTAVCRRTGGPRPR
jgi:hypothetical protein